jgi:hypothetical protein
MIQYKGCRIRLAAERIRGGRNSPTGWKPIAVVEVPENDSFTVHPVEPPRIQILRMKQEADQIALQLARNWIERRLKSKASHTSRRER